MTEFEEGAELNADVVHAKIMGRAQELANQAYRDIAGETPEPVYKAGTRFKAPPGKRKGVTEGEVFRYDAIQSKRGGLTLSIEPGIDNTLSNEERQRMWEIGAQAIEDALFEYQALWVAGIFADMSEGFNYFDRFIAQGEQTTLF